MLRKGNELQGAVEGQMVGPYFPVNMSVMGAERDFHDLDEHPVNLNGATIGPALLLVSATLLALPQGRVALTRRRGGITHRELAGNR